MGPRNLVVGSGVVAVLLVAGACATPVQRLAMTIPAQPIESKETPMSGEVGLLEAQGEFALALRLLEAGSSGTECDVTRRRLRLRARLGQTREALGVLDEGRTCFDPGETAILTAAFLLELQEPARAAQALEQAPAPKGLDAYAAFLAADANARLRRWEDVQKAVLRTRDIRLPAQMENRLRLLQGLAAFHTGDFEGLERIGGRLGRAAADDDETGLHLFDLARSSLAAGRTRQAQEWLLDLLETRPTPAESAYTTLVAGIDEPEATLRIATYEMQTGRHARARDRLRNRVRVLPAGPQRAEVHLLIADSYLREGQTQRCLRELEQAERDALVGSPAEMEVLRLRARAHRRLGQREQVRALYQEIAERFPSSDIADNVLYEVGWLYEEKGELGKAEKAYVHCARTYTRRSLADDARLRAGLCALRDDRAVDARSHFAELVTEHSESPLLDRALYWQLISCQRLGDMEKTRSLLDRLQIEFPWSYFTVLAQWRLREEPGTEGPPGRVRQQDPSSVSMDGLDLALRTHTMYEQSIADLRRHAGLRVPDDFEQSSRLWRFFLEHGLEHEARGETRRLETRYARRPGALLEILAQSYTHGAHGRLVRLAYKLGLLLDDPALRPHVDVLLHPAPYGVSLATASRTYGLSHATLLGLIRRESAFEPRIDSRAGARGLMQIMPRVGIELGKRSGRIDFHPDDLYRPDVNLELGCRLLADELRRASGSLPQALAAYNAGGDRASAWAKRVRPQEPEEMYLEVVGYLETRTYVAKVLGSQEVYRHLYDLP